MLALIRLIRNGERMTKYTPTEPTDVMVGTRLASGERWAQRPGETPRVSRPGSPILTLRATRIANDRVSITSTCIEEKNYWDMSVSVHTLFSGIERTVVPSSPTQAPIFSFRSLVSVREVSKSMTKKTVIQRVAHGWYSIWQLSDRQILQAVRKILPEDVVLCGETAALIYGIDLRPPSSYGETFRICVARPEGSRALRRPGVRCRVVRFERGDVINREGLRCSSPLRTLIDLASSATIDFATHLMEVFIRRGLVSYRQIRKRVERMAGFRGVRTLRAALAYADTQSESPQETAVRIRLIEAGLPVPETQIRVLVPGREHPYRIDLGWRRQSGQVRQQQVQTEMNLGLEFNSDAYHPLHGPKAEEDRRRQAEIEAQGWVIVAVRTRDLRGTSHTFEKTVAELLGRKLRTIVRKKWAKNRWIKYRNAWTRLNESRWPEWTKPQARQGRRGRPSST